MYACFILECVTLLLSLQVTVDGVDFHSIRVSAATRQQLCVCVFSSSLCVLFFFSVYRQKRSKFVLFYVFMRMYSVPDCRQCKDENIQFVSYCSSGILLQPTHTHAHACTYARTHTTPAALFHIQMPHDSTNMNLLHRNSSCGFCPP